MPPSPPHAQGASPPCAGRFLLRSVASRIARRVQDAPWLTERQTDKDRQAYGADRRTVFRGASELTRLKRGPRGGKRLHGLSGEGGVAFGPTANN